MPWSSSPWKILKNTRPAEWHIEIAAGSSSFPRAKKPGGVITRRKSVVLDVSARQAYEDGGAEGIRTPDPHNAIVVLYQLSYDPILAGAEI